jgi:hypothetical protein
MITHCLSVTPCWLTFKLRPFCGALMSLHVVLGTTGALMIHAFSNRLCLALPLQLLECSSALENDNAVLQQHHGPHELGFVAMVFTR